MYKWEFRILGVLIAMFAFAMGGVSFVVAIGLWSCGDFALRAMAVYLVCFGSLFLAMAAMGAYRVFTDKVS